MFSRSQTELETFAKQASEAYLTSGVALNESVKKIAMASDLSAEQIKRVCETANHKVNDALLKSSSSRLFNFPLADARSIIDEVRSDEPPCECRDYLFAPKTASGVTTPTDFCIKLNHGDSTPATKTAAARDLTLQLKSLYDNAKHIKIASLRKVSNLREEMYSMVDQMIGSGYKLEDLYLASKTASSKPEIVREVFTYIADRMKKEGKIDKALKISMRKIADESAMSGEDGSLGKYPVGDHWVKVVMTNNTLSSRFHLMDEAQSDAARADAAMGHVSDALTMVKTMNTDGKTKS